MLLNQYTLNDVISISGVGLHTGRNVNLTIKPADANHGFKFIRVDLANNPVINAELRNVSSTNRSTTIKKDDVQVSTVEHVLAALVGMGIDNAILEIDGPEMPIMDGSSLDFVNAINKVGVKEQDEEKEYLVIKEPFEFIDEETGTEYLALPADDFEITTMIDFDSVVLGQQYAHLNNLKDFEKEIAPNRTFVFLHELEALLDQDLIKGGDLDNAVVIVDRVMNKEALKHLAVKLNKETVEVVEEGILNTTNLRFKNEPARHKLLDILGDLALVGKPIKGKIIASKPGHKSNVKFGKKLKEIFKKQQKIKGVPVYDPNATPVKDINVIHGFLPHRHPFLLVDKIIEQTETKIVGVKNVTHGEYFFQGHFPNNPVFPGVLQIEALAQCGGILALSGVPDPENWDTYFVKINNTKFKAKVVPGDTLLLKMELLSPIRRGIVQMWGTAFVGNKVVSEGELIAQIIRRPDA